jgi:sn-glycerol 3-phosphate transport system substrate-binding protein
MTRTRAHGPTVRWLALAFALALVAAACGGGDDGDDDGGAASGDLPECPVDALDSATQPVEVVVWHSYVGKTSDTLVALADQYNASQSKVRVRVESQGNNYDELWRKYQQGAQAGDLPGIAILEDTNTEAVIDSGTVLPAQSCIDATGYDTSDLVPSAVDYYSADGALYPGTVNLSTPLVYYNTNHFRAAGLDPADPPGTLDELRQTAEAIKAAGVADTPVVLNLESWFFETWVTGADAGIVDNDNGRGDGQTTEAVFDGGPMNEAVTWVKDMIDAGLLEPIPNTPGGINQYLALAEQNGSMTIATSTAATTIEAFLSGDTSVTDDVPADASDVDLTQLAFDAGPFPGLDTPGRVQIGGGAWYITNTTPPEVQAAAWDFITWWNRPETQVIWHLEGSYLPFSETAAEDAAVVESWTTDQSGSWLAVSYQQLTEGVDPQWPGPLIGPYDQFRDALENGLDAVALSGADPAAEITKAADATTAAITAYNEENF